MKPDLNDAMVERIWEHGVLPYIEERLFGQGGDRMGDFALDKLRGTWPSRRSCRETGIQVTRLPRTAKTVLRQCAN